MFDRVFAVNVKGSFFMMQKVLAHMIANPTDAVFPAQETPRMSDNRGAAWQRFKAGGAAGAGAGSATATATGVTGSASTP